MREDLSPIEQARTFSVLLDDLRMTSAVLAKRIGRSRADIANTMRLLELPDEVVEMIDAGALTKGHGKVLLTEPDHHRRLVLARQAAERGWSVRALEARDRPGGDAVRSAPVAGPRSVRRGDPARGGDHASDRVRGDRQAASQRLPDPARPPSRRSPRTRPRRRHRSTLMSAVREHAVPRGTGPAFSPALGPALGAGRRMAPAPASTGFSGRA